MIGKWILSPSLLSADFTCLGEQIAALENAGVDWLHVDVMDGHFAPNISMGPQIVEACHRISSMPVDVHLMIENSENYIGAFANAGANLITIHIEASKYPSRTLQSIRDVGCRPGIALNPSTNVDKIMKLFPLVDMVLVLGTNPGFSGQTFIPQVLAKIAAIREENPDGLIEVDGGMNTQTLPAAFQAGANVFVVGNAIFKHPKGILHGVRELRTLC
ncbi:MAG: ribulose-phosphate 3-epimerase [Anaerolineales bacterium]|jgi:ribulose-phosphate 3-epimerase